MSSELPLLTRPQLSAEQIEKIQKQQGAREERAKSRLLARLKLADEASLQRRHKTILRWALRHRQSDLATHFATIFVLLSVKNVLSRIADSDLMTVRSQNEKLKSEAEYYREKVVKTLVNTSNGGRTKALNSPKAAAMRKARKFHRDWREGKYKFDNNELFAAEAIRLFPPLQSIGYLARTKVPAWDKEIGWKPKRGKKSVC